MKGNLEEGDELVIPTSPSFAGIDQNDILVKIPNGKDSDPETPASSGESMELSSLSDEMENEVFVSGCQTPTGRIFDPFAPASEKLAFAPKKKITSKSRFPLRRQLTFDFCLEDAFDDADEERQYLESLRESFLDLIISNQLRGFCGKSVESSELFKTPTCMPLLTGIAETCPDAPMRPGLKSRRIADSVCRKLEFGTNFDD